MAISNLQRWHGSMQTWVSSATRQLPAHAKPIAVKPASAHKFDHSVLVPPSVPETDTAQTTIHSQEHQRLTGQPEFVYTTVALKTSGQRVKRHRAYSRATGGVKSSRQSTGSSYRAFESLEGSALPLMMISADAAIEEQQELQQAQPMQKRTHRRCSTINQQHSTIPQAHNVANRDVVDQASIQAMQLADSPGAANHFTLLPPVDQTTQSAQLEQPAIENLQTDVHTPNVLRQQVENHLQACCRMLNIRRGKTLSESHSLQTVLLRVPSPALLPQRMLSLSRLLQLPYHSVREMVKVHPQLLLHDIDDIEQHALQLATLLHGPNATIHDVKTILKLHPTLLTKPHTAEQAMLGIARCLQPLIGMSSVYKLILSYPSILAHTSAPTGQNFTAVLNILAQELECSQAEVSHTCGKVLPHILVRSPAAIQGCCSALRLSWGLDAHQLHQLISMQPQLLLMSPGTAQVVGRTSRKLIGKSKHWHADMQLLLEKPSMLAKLLGFNSDRLSRLDYLVSTHRDAGIHWSGALAMPDSDWDDMYPAYQTWLRQQGR